MGNPIWIILIILVIAVICYLKSGKKDEKDDLYGNSERVLLGGGGFFDGQQIPIKEELVLGRNAESCNLVFPEKAKGISGVHCKVSIDKMGVGVTDLGSTYGTYVRNGMRLKPNETCYLDIGDSFYLGNTTNIFLMR